jgi:hypothetical protein
VESHISRNTSEMWGTLGSLFPNYSTFPFPYKLSWDDGVFCLCVAYHFEIADSANG